MSIRDVIERAQREPPYAPSYADSLEDLLKCTVFEPIPWDRRALERALVCELPSEIVELWNICGGLRIYCDDLWCPGGLVIFPPNEDNLVKQNNRYQRIWRDGVLPGDFVFGKFQDVAEPPLLRCDNGAGDYGSVIVVAEGEARAEWYKAASSLEEFLVKYMDAHGEKYWDYHYQKRLAERAAQELALKKQQN